MFPSWYRRGWVKLLRSRLHRLAAVVHGHFQEEKTIAGVQVEVQ
jgi:hypothetical protein